MTLSDRSAPLPSPAPADAHRAARPLDAPLAELLDAVSRMLESHADGWRCALYLVEQTAGGAARLRLGAAPTLPAAVAGALDGVTVDATGVVGRALHTRAAVLVRDLAADGDAGPLAAPALAQGLGAAWCIPVSDAAGDVVAALVALHGAGALPGPREGEAAATVARVAGIAIAQEEARARARVQEERFRALIEHTSEMITIADAEGRLTYASPAFERIMGWRAADVVGRPAAELCHPDDAPVVARRVAELVAEPGLVVREELRMRHRDGSWRTLSVVAESMLDQPAVRGIVTTARDVTERVELEAQLRQVQKMEAIGQLAGGIAHDFNNLLMVMGGNAEFLRARLERAAVPHDELTDIEEAIGRARALTRQLLTFSRKQPRRPRLVDLGAQLAELDGMLRRLIGEHVALLTDVADEPLPVRADPAQLEQVVLNLVVNARDAVEGTDAPTIELAASAVHVAPERARRHADMVAGPYVALTVRDTGVGMDAATRARIFEPFFTTKPKGKGTGLGLATVYAIVRQMGGAVEVESAPGAGSTFVVLLPRAAEPVTNADPAPRATPQPHGSETILLVEDEAPVRATIRRMLERRGYSVLEAKHGADALAVCARHAEHIGLVLSDIVMPEMGAAPLLERLAADYPRLPVLLMSGYSEQAVNGKQFAERGLEILEKPFEPELLAQRVRAALDRAR